MAKAPPIVIPAVLEPLVTTDGDAGSWPYRRKAKAAHRKAYGDDTAAAISLSPLPAIDARAAGRGFRFDPERAGRAVYFIERMCRHTDGQHAGKPFQILPWQRDLLCRLFGWVDAAGVRRFRAAYVQIPKKNGKSTLMSALGLYLILFDGEASAEVVCAATAVHQADLIFREASRMVKLNPILAKRLTENVQTKRLYDAQTFSSMRAISADAGVHEGLKCSAVIIDELHAHPNRLLFDTLRYAGAARRQPLLLTVTTAGDDRHSVCYEQLRYAQQVATASIDDDTFLPVIYAADETPDGKRHEADFSRPKVFQDPKVWERANPSLGATLSAAEFATASAEAASSPSRVNAFLRYRLNIWTEASDRWLGAEAWDACALDGLDLPTTELGCPPWNACADLVESEVMSGRVAFMGVDLSSQSDTTAAVVFVPPVEGKTGLLLARFWVPTDNAPVRETRDRVPYLTWARDPGRLVLTEGNVQHFDRVAHELSMLARRFRIRTVAIDPYSALGIEQHLTADGVEVLRVHQGMASMSTPTKRLEQLVSKREIRHFGCPVMRWMVANTVAEITHEGVKPSKKRSTERIDGVIASILAIAPWMANRDAESVYDKRMRSGGPVLVVV